MFYFSPLLAIFFLPYLPLWSDSMDTQQTKEWLESRELIKKVSDFASRQVICTRTKLKKDGLDGVRKWFQTLHDRKEELLAFTEEGISLESVFIEKAGDDYFLIFYARSQDFKKTFEAIQKAMLPITVYHYNCWEAYCEKESEILELVFDLQRNH